MKKVKFVLLYSVLTLLFAMTIVRLNKNYDRYYRIPGINNEARSKIEYYLDEEEKEYLVEHGVHINHFINYIHEDDFKMKNYEYYNYISDYSTYGSLGNMLSYVNKLVDAIQPTNMTKLDFYKVLIDNQLSDDYLEKKDIFVPEYVHTYAIVKNNSNDENYIGKVNHMINLYVEAGQHLSQGLKDIESLSLYYSLDNCCELVEHYIENPGFKYILNPTDCTLVLNENDYLGNYEPKNLEMANHISRLSYFMYIEKEAYNHLEEMLNDLKQMNFEESIIMMDAFQSLDKVRSQGLNVSEMQLGTTVLLKASNMKTEEFSNTDSKKWLDENAHMYGFILRDESVFAYRYVGQDLATKLYENNMTLEMIGHEQ